MKYITNSIVFIVVIVSVCCISLKANATSYIYDSLNRLTNVSYDNGNYISYTYDPAGNIVGVEVSDTTTPDLEVEDFNGDATIDLQDTILALQVLTGQEPASLVDNYSTIHNGEQIDIAKVVGILSQMAVGDVECTDPGIGTWNIFVAGTQVGWFTLSSDGTYIDNDGETGTWSFSNNTVTIVTDNFSAVGTLESDCSSMSGTSEGDAFTATKS